MMIFKSIVLVAGFMAMSYITTLTSLYIIDGDGYCYDDKPQCAMIISWIVMACTGMIASIIYGTMVCRYINHPVEVLTPRVQMREGSYAYV